MQKASWQTPMVTPAVARLPIRHAFGIGDGRTLFVVNDMARKSPAIITMTISNGVNIACPVIKRPTIKKSTGCEFRGNPAGDSDLMSATVPI